MKSLVAPLSLLLGLLVVGTPLLAFAQSYNPPKRGLPGRREGAGTRGTCMQGQRFLMPLTPTDGFSATTSSTPTFFWYVPPTIARMAEFSLLDGKDKLLYKTTFNLTSEGGIIGFTLPESVTSSMVEPGKDYYWQFSVLCDPNQPSKNPFVEGVVQRVQPDSTLLAQLQSASPRERAKIYATSGIWQDAIATLAQQRCVNPQDQSLDDSWANLLQSVRLAEFAQEPIAQTCPAISSKP